MKIVIKVKNTYTVTFDRIFVINENNLVDFVQAVININIKKCDGNQMNNFSKIKIKPVA